MSPKPLLLMDTSKKGWDQWKLPAVASCSLNLPISKNFSNISARFFLWDILISCRWCQTDCLIPGVWKMALKDFLITAVRGWSFNCDWMINSKMKYLFFESRVNVSRSSWSYTVRLMNNSRSCSLSSFPLAHQLRVSKPMSHFVASQLLFTQKLNSRWQKVFRLNLISRRVSLEIAGFLFYMEECSLLSMGKTSVVWTNHGVLAWPFDLCSSRASLKARVLLLWAEISCLGCRECRTSF